ncbi:energy-coupling factor transporter ATPase [Staphylococcus massiliensis]|uniref:Cobalt transporter ATP-binding subunit n=1 Tax=Staphylococcus massiliensis S46 TaxID=1229783 RepID=K9B2B7_9STAP|nr:energy-coupling factor transporter ATPase [Staphylococcus massiliensis]EKU48902.1 cobalt transporter ATP-binding subunit [Staphylococcus massiliensis S46]MCG3399342.1 energy-coupling factor transporter ATPase [Staphylococcus massiliensis]MCG3402557.1 energy-coupling factor transporter ATPase [Staphylococcus massiliensis]PNZ98815.1 energy-coupling factor transporter ATPase [Staphylococcus massiliensis CCUG 55927]
MCRTEPAVAFENVTFSYQGDARHILKDVSFEVPKGSWTSIVGHNGSGKSTIAKLIVGIETVNEGTIKINGDIHDKASLKTMREQVGIVFQNPDNQFVGSTVAYDVAFGLENYAVPHDEMRATVDDVLKKVGMYDKRYHEPESLSGGQKERVAIAGILALKPDIIILDESTAMLDPEGKQDILKLVSTLKEEEGMTVISITHDLNETLEADRIIVMNQGQVHQVGTMNDVFKDAEQLKSIGLTLPFTFRIRDLLDLDIENCTYERLVERL